MTAWKKNTTTVLPWRRRGRRRRIAFFTCFFISKSRAYAFFLALHNELFQRLSPAALTVSHIPLAKLEDLVTKQLVSKWLALNHHLNNIQFSKSHLTCAACLLLDSGPQSKGTNTTGKDKSVLDGEMCLTLISGDWGEEYCSFMVMLIS